MNGKNDYIPVPSVRRLPLYHGFLKELKARGETTVSCTGIAEQFKLLPIQARKDLAITGIRGKPKIGYDLSELMNAIEEFLGWNNAKDAFLIGAGHLGTALLGYTPFNELGISIIAAFDSDPEKVGTQIKGREVLNVEKLSALIARMRVKIAVLTVPQEKAREVVDIMVDAGIRAIWNFTSATLKTPDSVIVEDVRLASSLSVLTRKLNEVLKSEKER